ncbi:MAG: ribosomal protein S18-alanine N-acetyltransferase [Hyphomicrobiales bacterium]|nr:ribosomal protein S18-alanine N-acetyltransferase [Hyphomicrobiales bacterium]
MNIEIGLAGPDDATPIAGLHGTTFARPWSPEEIRALLTGPGAIELTGQLAGQSVGFLIARALSFEAELLSIGVLPDYRGSGVGHQLMAALLSELTARRALSLFLEVDGTNAPAVRLYHRLGFRRVGIRKQYYKIHNGGRSDAWVMRKDLEVPPLTEDVPLEQTPMGLR